MLKTTDRCRSQSSIAAATIGSSKIFPQEAIPRLVVNAMEPLKWRWRHPSGTEAASSVTVEASNL
jgi:hypothetical protein